LLSLRADTTTGAAPFHRPADWDTDADGMPDTWEKAHNLNSSMPDHNGDFDTDGYTNLEEYINEIAAWPAPQPIGFNGATSNRYAQLGNWDSRWQPSKYDEVHIDSGTAVVDAPGQHAGTFVIAANSGDTAKLEISSGWLRANSAVIVGGADGANATLGLGGGELSTPALKKGSASHFNFTGGTLHAALIDFDLVIDGGLLAVNEESGTTINGDLAINGGAIALDITSPATYSRLNADGNIALAGELRITLGNDFLPQPEDKFTIVTGESIEGTFANLDTGHRVRVAGSAGSFLVAMEATQVTLSNFLPSKALPGDYNSDGVVDSADYVVWRRTIGQSGNNLTADGNGNQVVDAGDYDVWRKNFGQGTALGNLAGFSVPEPRTTAPLLVLVSAMLGGRRLP
jgi:hypothetical protein